MFNEAKRNYIIYQFNFDIHCQRIITNYMCDFISSYDKRQPLLSKGGSKVQQVWAMPRLWSKLLVFLVVSLEGN
jgi:hypothetical protein